MPVESYVPTAIFSTPFRAFEEKKEGKRINNLGLEPETFVSREMGFLIFYFHS